MPLFSVENFDLPTFIFRRSFRRQTCRKDNVFHIWRFFLKKRRKLESLLNQSKVEISMEIHWLGNATPWKILTRYFPRSTSKLYVKEQNKPLQYVWFRPFKECHDLIPYKITHFKAVVVASWEKVLYVRSSQISLHRNAKAFKKYVQAIYSTNQNVFPWHN